LKAPHGDQLVHDYLSRLQSALAGVPADRRDEIVGEIAGHIAEERARVENETDADVRNLLERIGDPVQLAAEAAPAVSSADAAAAAASRSHVGIVEILALILTPLLWPVGVILLWLSPAWSIRDKVIGTLVPPGGYLGIAFAGVPAALIVASSNSSQCVTTSDSSGSVLAQTCTGFTAQPQWEQTLIQAIAIAVFVLLLILPVLTGIYLATRLRKRHPAAPAVMAISPA
jgi:uncharacterized membrane protein